MLIGYARVSTVDQNPALQLDALKAAGCEKLFVEHASGSDRDRPELAKALAFCRQGDVFVSWKIDRVARSTAHLLEIMTGLDRRKVGFRLITQPIDTTTAAGRLMFTMVGAFAEFEREMIRERTVSGLQAARARGVKLGRPRKPENKPVDNFLPSVPFDADNPLPG